MSDLAEMRARVARLLSGQREVRDLDRLFSWVRFRSFGHRLVRDIGDFTAHLEDRDKGSTHEGIGLIRQSLSYHLSITKVLSDDSASLEDMASAALASLEVDPPENVKRQFRLGKAAVKTHLQSALGKVQSLDGRVLTVQTPITQIEIDALRAYVGTVVVAPPITQGKLVSELGSVLVKNNLLEARQISKLKEQAEWVAIFAIEKMHLARLRLFDGASAKLLLCVDPIENDGRGVLSIAAEMYLGHHTFMVSAFSSTCAPSDWFEEWSGNRSQMTVINRPIEISGLGKLRLLQ